MASFSLWFISFLCLLFGHGILKLQASHHVYKAQASQFFPHHYQQPYRTSYHFQPPKNWMNDPNGPMIYKGIYHLFYQYNPKGAVWGNIVWAHSTSTDLINWVPHEHAIYPSQPSDINGCWSGSATILPGGKPAILYTGINPKNQQVQNLAVPKNLSDPYLREWVKSPKNPLMAPTPLNHINSSSFRDPTTAWLGPDRKWRVIIGSKINTRGLAIMYRSKDFIQWDQVDHPLHYGDGMGMWECPDFFPVAKNGSRSGIDTTVTVSGWHVKHVLKMSLDDTKHDIYIIGRYDLEKEIYVPDKGSIENYNGLRYDYGKYYASKTFFDTQNKRRVLWGWVNESSSVHDDIKKGWSGLQAIPRTIWLDTSRKQLIQWPIVEIQKLRKDKLKLTNKVVKKGSTIEIQGITAAQADIEVSFKVRNFKKAEVLKPEWKDPQLLCSKKGTEEGGVGPFGLLVLASKDLKEYTSVFFRIFKGHNKYVVLMCSDQSRSSLNSNNDKTTYGAFLDVDPLRENVSLRSLIDHSIVESFGSKGKACITARVYPTLAIGENVGLYVFNNGTEAVAITKLNAWSMNKAQIN